MNREDKIIEFYNKLSRYIDLVDYTFKINDIKDTIIDLFGKIIDNNNDYLLTDGYLFYLIDKSKTDYKDRFFTSIIDTLTAIANNDKDKIVVEMAYYFSSTRLSYNLRELLNKAEKEILKAHENSVDKLSKLHDWISNMNGGIIETHILIAYAGKAILDRNFDEYHEIVNGVIENAQEIIDELKLNGVFTEEETDYGLKYRFNADEVITYLYNRSNPKIRIN